MYNKEIKPKLRKLIKHFKGQAKLSKAFEEIINVKISQQGISYILINDCTEKTAIAIKKLYNLTFER